MPISLPAAAVTPIKTPQVISGLSPPPLSVFVPPPSVPHTPAVALAAAAGGVDNCTPRPLSASILSPGSCGTPPSATATSTVQLGWQGLLEISRNSGASGVLGWRVDEDPSKDCKIEICCTAHPRPSVRRLVKGVIRGLKGCQVRRNVCLLACGVVD
jgi:hypothetical protein